MVSFNTSSLIISALVSGCIALGALSWGYQRGATKQVHAVKDPNTCLYVPGGGFSGFFYHIGHLQATSTAKPTVSNIIAGSESDNVDTDYYCYSAGCLAITAALGNITVFDIIDALWDLQDLMRTGNISQFEMVEGFVDYLISTGRERTLIDAALAKMHIITTAVLPAEGWLSPPKLETVVRTPQSLRELKEMLLQTTWIPGVTGNGWVSDDHLDGGLTTSSHPACSSAVEVPQFTWTWESLEFYANVLFGVTMSKEQAERFWFAGVKQGLQVAGRKV
ncbi:expressed unknown protein [Seminavis robusta]|uniref:Uncharacterized protein n=1 Tax=Seminavis robusta TaxID=568900 RepID=A0A9N8DRA7_9STRA|nr:expressed unknown protein [Seminavis robusta]|eukprot:Sro199_g084350.1 n/a (278) ;mRNA; r:34722-35555